MNSKPHLSIDDPLIQAAFEGVYKSGKRLFFRINPEGHHHKIAVVHALDDIAITYENKMGLIASFPFPMLAYSSERMKMKAAAKPKVVRVAAAADADEDDIAEEEAHVASVSGKKSQYSLVHQNNGYWGCYDGREATVVLFKTLQQAKDYINDLLHGRDSFRSFYGNKIGS
jgi:hypothetical protein